MLGFEPRISVYKTERSNPDFSLPSKVVAPRGSPVAGTPCGVCWCLWQELHPHWTGSKPVASAVGLHKRNGAQCRCRPGVSCLEDRHLGCWTNRAEKGGGLDRSCTCTPFRTPAPRAGAASITPQGLKRKAEAGIEPASRPDPSSSQIKDGVRHSRETDFCLRELGP